MIRNIADTILDTARAAGIRLADSDLDADTALATPAPKAALTTYIEKCPKCHGSGMWLAPTSLGHNKCTQCKGHGKIAFKSSKEQRQKAREAAANRKIAKQATNLEKFEAEHPELKEWWTDSTFPFAVSLRAAVIKYGHLTDNQFHSAQKAAATLAAKKASNAAAQAAAAADAKPVSTAAMEAVFGTALQNGLKRPILRIGEFRFRPAKPDGKNPGAIYVKDDNGVYLGKILGGEFKRAWNNCPSDVADKVAAAAADPKEAAIQHGRLTGCCAICGRGLVDPESVKRGIGPVCAEKFGW